MKVCEKCHTEIDTKEGENACPQCDGQERRVSKPRKKRTSRKDMDSLMASLGMKRVRGALGGTYYE